MRQCEHLNYHSVSKRQPCWFHCDDCDRPFDKHDYSSPERQRKLRLDGKPWHLQKCQTKGCKSQISYDATSDCFNGKNRIIIS